MQKKVCSLFTVLCVVAVSLGGGCKSTEQPLIMATEAGFAPYEYIEDDEIIGIDVDIAREIARELGRELVIADMEFDAIIPAVANGEADFGAAGLSVHPDRADLVDFSIEYNISEQVIISYKNNPIQGDDLISCRVGVQRGTTEDAYMGALLGEDSPRLVRYSKYNQAVADLNAQQIDAIVTGSLAAQEIVHHSPDLMIQDDVLYSESHAFCVQKGNEELLKVINILMRRLLENGQISEYTVNHSSKQYA